MKEGGHEVDVVLCSPEMSRYGGQLEKQQAKSDREAPQPRDFVDHVSVEYRLVAPLGTILHVGFQRSLACEGKTAQRVHDEIDPEHVRP